ncbi:MAG: methyltransferase domain-containing protein [Solirubrobacteraceae bacterium]|nr:methyltransferase domain-containing protein [Solirubrobacteraceae bacterium]
MDARDRWNERYAAAGPPRIAGAPARWLVEHERLLTGAGRALDVACGDGRNALHLAQLGYTVDAIDVSDVAIEQLRAVAGERGLAVRASVVDLEREPLPAGPYDVIVTFNYLQRDLFDALQDALAPGGLLLYETLAQAHVEQLGKRFNPDYLLGDGELLGAFGRLQVVAHQEGVVERPDGPRGVASLVARRPAVAVDA